MSVIILVGLGELMVIFGGVCFVNKGRMFGFLISISWTSKDILHLELKLKAYMDMMLFLHLIGGINNSFNMGRIDRHPTNQETTTDRVHCPLKCCFWLSRHIKLLDTTTHQNPPHSKRSPLVDDDLDEEEAIKVTEKKNLKNNIEDETLEINDVVSIKEARNQPLKNAIGNLNQRTLRNKLDENGVVSRNKARLIFQGYNQKEGINYDETYAAVASFINEEVYVAQPSRFIDFEKPDHVYKLKKALYGLKQAPKSCLEDSKPMKTPMSSDAKITKDEKCESVDSTKYRGMIGSLLFLTASRPDIMFSVCLCARFLEDPKTSHLEAVKRIF
uniref:Reverse transcriptase Ty1/copia-type domain-containing protein n=1 Tax=Tanacetum cinerariifolium TaxID=118510 RepID=A0A6L2NBU7_TANCI|nr:hypothetical protein [Tanacetum cinerariifolium]